jgi:isoquinoline 1-oxidoreductase beta subunit
LVLVGGAALVAFGARRLVWPFVRLRVGKTTFPGGAPPLQGKVPGSPFAWCEIGGDGRVHFYPPRAELGQGSHTLLAQLLAEELEVDPGAVVVHQPDTSRGFDARAMTVVGSSSVYALQQPLREAAATLREALRAEAARQLGCPVEEIVASGGRCRSLKDPVRVLDYGEMAAARTLPWDVPRAAPALKTPNDFVAVGRSVPRVDLPEKVTGRAVFGHDVRLPGMLYGAVARPPRHGSRLRRVEAAESVRRLLGVAAVVIEDGFAGVVRSPGGAPPPTAWASPSPCARSGTWASAPTTSRGARRTPFGTSPSSSASPPKPSPDTPGASRPGPTTSGRSTSTSATGDPPRRTSKRSSAGWWSGRWSTTTPPCS